jgi:hypothetical protein
VKKLRVLNVSDASVTAHVVMTCRRMVMLVDPKEKISLISLGVLGVHVEAPVHPVSLQIC